MLKPPFLQADDYFPVTPSDTDDLAADPANPNPSEYRIATLRVNDEGTVTVVIVSPYDSDASREVTITVSGPADLPYVCKRVKESGTTATDIVALVKRL